MEKCYRRLTTLPHRLPGMYDGGDCGSSGDDGADGSYDGVVIMVCGYYGGGSYDGGDNMVVVVVVFDSGEEDGVSR